MPARSLLRPAPHATWRLRPQDFARVAIAKMPEFSPQNISNLLWAYAKLGVQHAELFAEGERARLQHLPLGSRRCWDGPPSPRPRPLLPERACAPLPLPRRTPRR